MTKIISLSATLTLIVVCASVSYAGAQCLIPTSGLISWWPGEGDATDIHDGNNGMLINGVTFAAGQVGQAFSLDGEDDHHVVIGNPTNLQITGELTLAAWINPETLNPGQVASIISKWGQSIQKDSYTMIIVESSGVIELAGGIGDGVTPDNTGFFGGVIQPGTWSHVAMTYNADNGDNIGYINGQQVGLRVRSRGINTSDLIVLIGREDSVLPRPFPGLIDEVLIYDRALSAAEIEALFDAGSGGQCEPECASLLVEANKHTVGLGSHPGSIKEPLVDIEVCAYDKSAGSCALNDCGGISHQNYSCIVGEFSGEGCAPVSCCRTDANGECTINLPAGDYVLISDDATKTVLPDPLGVSASDLFCGEIKKKHLQQIVKADGKKVPGKTSRRTGSELLVIEPEYLEWSGTEELYPFVFESLGDWQVTTSVTPPEGFVADYQSLSEEVTSEVEAIQFTITDVGSDWIPTEVQHAVEHNGRREILLSRIGVRLTSELAQARGLNRFGQPLGGSGQPIPEFRFDPRVEWPAEVVGWIEPSAVDPKWTIKLRVQSTSEISLAIRRGLEGKVVFVLVAGTLEPGEYEYIWDGLDASGQSLGPSPYFLTLTADEASESVLMFHY